jgi:6-phospho-beta-glucosidase
MVRYAQLAARLAPHAWLVTFTNPVSIVTQAVVQESDARVIGICDTPNELFEDAAHALDLPASKCAYDFFGLNHLGWLREVYFKGEPQMHRLWTDPSRLDAAYRTPLFEPERLQAIGLLPSEYVYYYYRPDVALAHLRHAGTSRGMVVAALTDALFADLAAGVADPIARYQQYLAARDSTYMQLESGSVVPRVKPDWAELSGYDRIALMTMQAIVHDTRDVIPLDVVNRGNLPFLRDDDVVEVPCVVDRNGPRALSVPTVPEHCQDLMLRVKEYERATVKAAFSGIREDRIHALQMNPLCAASPNVPAIVDALIPS